MDTDNLVLFYQKTCPFCIKVLDFMEENDIDIKTREITQDSDAAEKLVNVGGKKQVPCLFINEKPLYESDDIIQWFKENLLS